MFNADETFIFINIFLCCLCIVLIAIIIGSEPTKIKDSNCIVYESNVYCLEKSDSNE